MILLLLLLSLARGFLLELPLEDFVMVPSALENGAWVAQSLISPQTYSASMTISLAIDSAVVELFIHCKQCELFGMSISLGLQTLPMFRGELDICTMGCFVNRTFEQGQGDALLNISIQAPGNEDGWLKVPYVQISGPDNGRWWVPTLVVFCSLIGMFVLAALIYHCIELPRRRRRHQLMN